MSISRSPARPLSFIFSVLLMAAAPDFARAAVDCTVVLEEASGKVLHREGNCSERFAPQSTFKLPLAIIGFDAGILIDEHRPRWEYQAKFKRSEREQKTTDPTLWEKDSIVWYSQEITRRLGQKAFGDYVRRVGFGNRDVSGGPGGTDGLTESWLMSSLKISADEQVDFLRRFLKGELPVSSRASAMTMAILPRFEAADGWSVQGKTGSGWLRGKNGKTDPSKPLGWFVGWAARDGRRVVFARLKIADHRYNDPISYAVRDGMIADLPRLVGQR